MTRSFLVLTFGLLCGCGLSAGGAAASREEPLSEWDPCTGQPGAPTPSGDPLGFLNPEDAGTLLEVANLTYQSDAGFALQGDVYLPAPFDAGLPGVVVMIHGGGWHACNRRRAAVAPVAELLSRSAHVAVFNIEYRMIQEGGEYPHNLEDVRCALEWIVANPYHLPIDPSRLALIGESAGAHLSLLAGVTQQREDLDPHCGPQARVSAVISYSGVSDLPALAASTAPSAYLPDVYAGPCDAGIPGFAAGPEPTRCADASPVAHVPAVAPSAQPWRTRFLLVHAPAGYDPVVPVDQSQRMHVGLAWQGAPTQLLVPAPATLDAELDGGCTAAAGQDHGFSPCLLIPAWTPTIATLRDAGL